MKFKKIFFASLIAIFLSLINLNIYSTDSKISFVPSFGIEKTYAHCKWRHPWHCVVDTVSSVIGAVKDAVVDVVNAVVDTAKVIVQATVGLIQATISTATGLIGALGGALGALVTGESLIKGWNCGYYKGTGAFVADNYEFLGGGCNTSRSDGIAFYVCKSDGSGVADPNLCPVAIYTCTSGGPDSSYYPDRGETIADADAKCNKAPKIFIK